MLGISSTDVMPPAAAAALEQWRRDTLAALAGSPLAGRVAAMAEYMARWSAWSGEEAEAGLWSALAAGVQTDFTRSPLARAMLDRSRRPPPQLLELAAADGPDPDTIRQGLKEQFFAEVRDPRGIHLARLDFAEAIRLAFANGVNGLVGHERPRDEDLDALAVELGGILAQHVVERTAAGRVPGGGAVAKRVERTIAKRAELTAAARDLLAECADAGAGALYDEVCSRCPVDCLTRAGERMDEVFFSAQRPGDHRPATAPDHRPTRP